MEEELTHKVLMHKEGDTYGPLTVAYLCPDHFKMAVDCLMIDKEYGLYWSQCLICN
jgi:hypothetical protein